MGPPSQVMLFLAALVTFGLVSSFRIGHRSEPGTDLVKGLAMLERQRRRVSAEDFINSERLAASRPMTLEDVSLLLGNGVINDDDWPHETGSFQNFDDDASANVYKNLLPEAASHPTRVKATATEVNGIFSQDDDNDGTSPGSSDETLSESPEKKKKEELINLHGDKQAGSTQLSLVSPKEKSTNERETPSGLDALTDEEVRVLMKAAGKLKQRAADITRRKKSIDTRGEDSYDNGGDDDTADDKVTGESADVAKMFATGDDDSLQGEKVPTIGLSEGDHEQSREPALTEEEEKEVAEEEEAEKEEEEEEEKEQQLVEALEKAKASSEKAEDSDDDEEEEEDGVINPLAEQIVSMQKRDLSPELITKYILMNRDKLQLGEEQQGNKQAEKRSSDDLMREEDVLNVDQDRLDVSDLSGAPPLIQAFVAKILALQSEIDGLRFKNRLEDLENDELTDALNEATIGQGEGTVSNEEWKSLQHAIEIEQALQDLKKKDDEAPEEEEDDDDEDVIDEEGFDDEDEPWRRKRGKEADDVDRYAGAIASRSSLQADPEISREDIERLLGSAYLMKEAEDRAREEEEEEEEMNSGGGEEDEPIASLFLAHADRCPAIQRYSNNCGLADLYNLPVDFEARALCNLHEMCYACGHSLSVSQPQCDLVYRAAVSSLCHGKEVCIDESEIFLRTMKLKTRYIPHVQASCRSRCTAQFMGMF